MGEVLKVFKQSWKHPDEIWAAVSLKKAERKMRGLRLDECDDKDVQFCFDILCQVSRSFAGVIKQLDKELRLPICVFYLVLRALDTIEDDTALPGDERAEHCNNFYKVLSKPGWTFSGAGYGAEKQLLVEFDKVIRVYGGLKRKYCLVICDITKKMGEGMAEFINKSRVESIKDWDLYCHYVAGLVGIGLSRMFSQSGMEDSSLEKDEKLSNEMGLFLQKTNIIRDYLEDINDNRIFWPQEVWKKYSHDLALFKERSYEQDALACMNDLVTNALELVPSCIHYMERLKTLDVFRFCAIPQVMAIATLSEVYNNPAVFHDVVKIRKGLAAKMIMDCTDLEYVKSVFYQFADDIQRRIPPSDPSAAKTTQLCQRIKAMTEPQGGKVAGTGLLTLALIVSLACFAMCAVGIVPVQLDSAGGLVSIGTGPLLVVGAGAISLAYVITISLLWVFGNK